jgi:hypothetical protein
MHAKGGRYDLKTPRASSTTLKNPQWFKSLWSHAMCRISRVRDMRIFSEIWIVGREYIHISTGLEHVVLR